MRQEIQTAGKFLLLIVLLFAFTSSAQAQTGTTRSKPSDRDDDYQIRARVDLVVVPVTVKGPNGELATGLAKEEFVLTEAGRQQEITNFTIDPVPLSAVVIVDTGLSASSLSTIQKTFPALAAAFSEFDEVAIYRFDKFVTKLLDFSRDPAVIEAAMNKLKDITGDPMPYPPAPGGPFSHAGPMVNGGAVLPPGQVGVTRTAPSKHSKVLNDAIFMATADLAKREPSRRKMLLIISDGNDEGSDHSIDDTTKHLLETGAQLYAVGLDQTILTRSFSLLNKYAASTGGDAYFVGRIQNIEQSYATAAEAARNQYVLGYVSSNKPGGGLPVFRDIQVSVSRPGYEALHRKGYYQYP
jgi:VWFA-related protein